MAPFYKGLTDFDENWSDRQLLAAIRGLPIPLDESPTKDTLQDNLHKNESNDKITQVEDKLFATTLSTGADSKHSDDSLSKNSLSNKDSTTQETLSIHIPNSKAGALSGFLPNAVSPSTSAPVSTSFMLKNSTTSSSSEFLSSSPSVPFPTIESNLEDTSSKDSDASLYKASDNDDDDNESKNTQDTDSATEKSSSSLVTRSRANTTSKYGLASPQDRSFSNELFLYRDPIECPICFLYYPKFLNLTRCCAQPICTECFVQIKRPDPHPPHDDTEEGPSTPGTGLSNTQPNSGIQSGVSGEPLLVSEPACCPYCMLPDFGVTYTGPPFRSGIEANKRPTALHSFTNISSSNSTSNSSNGSKTMLQSLSEDKLTDTTPKDAENALSTAASSSSTLSTAGNGIFYSTSKRRGSIPANSPEVVTIDKIRPDWSVKLASARAHAARRSAQATALHASAFLFENDLTQRSSNSGRRNIMSGRRRGSAPSRNQSSISNNGSNTSSRQAPRLMINEGQSNAENRRIQQLEEIMVKEAIRLSILEEENRKLKLARDEESNNENSSLR